VGPWEGGEGGVQEPPLHHLHHLSADRVAELSTLNPRDISGADASADLVTGQRWSWLRPVAIVNHPRLPTESMNAIATQAALVAGVVAAFMVGPGVALAFILLRKRRLARV